MSKDLQGYTAPVLHPYGLTTFEQIEAFFNNFAVHVTTSLQPVLTLNLGDVSFIRPAGIVALISIARLWHRQHAGYILISEIQPAVYAYLERMNLFAEFGNVIKFPKHFVPAETYSRSDKSKSLLEILMLPYGELENAHSTGSAIARIEQILQVQYGPHPGVRRLCSIFSEILTNIVHSQDEGYALIQSYRDHPETGRRVELAVGDLGIGIQKSLLSNEMIANHVVKYSLVRGSDFILHSLEEGVSSRSDWTENGRGLGLSMVSQKVGQWEQGVLRIRSGSSVVELAQHHEPPRIVDDLVYIPGTQVIISVSAKPLGQN